MKEWIIRRVILGSIVKAAEGGYGPRVKAVYWWFRGKKTWIGFGAGVIMYALNEGIILGLCDVCVDWAKFLAFVVTSIFLPAGFVDEAIHFTPPKKD